MLYLATATTKYVNEYHNHTPHAVLLSGMKGVGLATLATKLATDAGQILEYVSPTQKTPTGPLTIYAEQIRALYDIAKTRMSRPHFIIIDDADRMNHTAQNALLKLLEEPNESIHFILTSHRPDELLPTIRSRVQQFRVPAIDDLSSRKLLKGLSVTEDSHLKQLLYISSGLPAELTRLATNPKQFTALGDQIANVRGFISGSSYQKMVVVHSFKDNRRQALEFIDLLLLVLYKVSVTKPSADILRLSDSIMNAQQSIAHNGNVRLQLTEVVLQ